MDRRDFDFWLREAARVRALEREEALLLMRLAMWGDEAAFSKAFSALEADLGHAEGTDSAKIEGNWAALRTIGRR